MDIKELAKRYSSMAKKKRKKSKWLIPFTEKELLSTGSTKLDLACSGNSIGGFIKGSYIFFAGSSSSGKTFLTLTCLAEAASNPNFDEYKLIYDAPEDGAKMDFSKFFGNKVAGRVEEPELTKGPSEYIEQFYTSLDRLQDANQPFIYILDSMDALTSKYEVTKALERKREQEGGRAAKGDYGDGKAKINSANLRRIVRKLPRTGSILVIICQERDNVGGGMFEAQNIYSGGRSLKFYATLQMWTSKSKTLKKTWKGKDRKIGVTSRISVKKNRLTGIESTIDVPIYHSYGIDDIGSCVDWLLEEKVWTKSGQSILAPDFEFKGSRNALIDKIETGNDEGFLKVIVQDTWNEIQQATKLKRKKRYD